ncbi:MAG: hypothetical protein U5K72_02525 [Balneolaceae bacterium]|nr:hypothetical protein [Balneolaceae bacterium]
MSIISSFLTDQKQIFTKLLILAFAAVLFHSCSGEDSSTEAVEFEPQVLRVKPDQAASEANEITQNTQAEVAEGLEYSLWASEKLIADPIAIDMDNQGRAWITVTNRSGNSEFDVRGVDDSWRIESMKWETVEDRREFLHTELAPEKVIKTPGYRTEMKMALTTGAIWPLWRKRSGKWKIPQVMQ